MNRILLLAAGLILIGCNKERATGNLEEGSGTEISPQLESFDDTTSRLKVDTISSAKGAEEAQKAEQAHKAEQAEEAKKTAEAQKTK